MPDDDSQQGLEDHPELDSTPSNFSPELIDLEYPQILLQPAFARLVSSSILTSSFESGGMSARGTPVLSESWTSVENAAEYPGEEELQSEDTDYGSIIDITGSDDVHSLNADDASSVSGHTLSSTDEFAPEEDAATRDPVFRPDLIEDSQLSSRTAHGPYGSARLAPLVLEELQESTQADQISLKHTLEVFDDEQIESLLTVLRNSKSKCVPKRQDISQLSGSVRMTVCQHNLRPDKPFKILFAGPGSTSQVKHDVLRKIGDALVAGVDICSPQRIEDTLQYHVMPTSFGPGFSAKSAELIPMHAQIVVDECVDVRANRLTFAGLDKGCRLTLRNGDTIASDGLALSNRNKLDWSPRT